LVYVGTAALGCPAEQSSATRALARQMLAADETWEPAALANFLCMPAVAGSNERLRQ